MDREVSHGNLSLGCGLMKHQLPAGGVILIAKGVSNSDDQTLTSQKSCYVKDVFPACSLEPIASERIAYDHEGSIPWISRLVRDRTIRDFNRVVRNKVDLNLEPVAKPNQCFLFLSRIVNSFK
jgi:hypothetical protein